MNTALLIEVIGALTYLIICISFFIKKSMWLDYVDYLRDPLRIFRLGLIMFPVSLLLIFLHNIWVLTPASIVTLFIWIAYIKSILFIFFPNRVVEKMMFKNETYAKILPIEGGIIGALSLIVLYNALM